MTDTLFALTETTHDTIVRSFDEITSRQGEHLPAPVQVEVTDRLSIHEVCEIMIAIQDRLNEGPWYLYYEISLGNGVGNALRLNVKRTSFHYS